MSDDALIARSIELDPRYPWPGDARQREAGVHVWALVGHWRLARAQDVAAVAGDYDLPVEAALAYYRRHAAAIDARLAENAPVEVACVAASCCSRTPCPR